MEIYVFILTLEKAVSDGPELLNCVLFGLDNRLLLGGDGGGRAVDLVVQDVEVRLWNEVLTYFFLSSILQLNGVSLKL